MKNNAHAGGQMSYYIDRTDSQVVGDVIDATYMHKEVARSKPIPIKIKVYVDQGTGETWAEPAKTFNEIYDIMEGV